METKRAKVTITSMTATKLIQRAIYWCDDCCITREATKPVRCPVCKEDMESTGTIETAADKTGKSIGEALTRIPDLVSE